MAEIEVWRGSVATWECDAMGHLNVGFYVMKSMEALAGLAAELGMPRAFAPTADATLVVREQHIRFLKEARPGAPLTMTGGIVNMDEALARVLLLRHQDGALAAAFQTVVAHATAREGRPFAWPDRVRARAQALAAEVPEKARPRSIGLEPVETQASLARAEQLGLPRTGLGVVMPADCDAFGRMRTEGFMARLSDAIPHVFGGRRPGNAEGEPPTVGGAAVEYRLIHHAWPRAGDRLELRSGSAGGDARVRRLVHWMLDPDTGRPWASAQATAISFDLATRKLIILSDEELARAEADTVPGLAL